MPTQGAGRVKFAGANGFSSPLASSGKQTRRASNIRGPQQGPAGPPPLGHTALQSVSGAFVSLAARRTVGVGSQELSTRVAVTLEENPQAEAAETCDEVQNEVLREGLNTFYLLTDSFRLLLFHSNSTV